jgi:hypothetical protein
LFGPDGSGKTSLAVGIANELSIQQHVCAYITAAKLYSLFAQNDPELTNPVRLWNWREASTLIIDDVNPGQPVKDEIMTAEEFKHYLLDLSFGTTNKDAISNKNLIWVLGTETGPGQDKWKNMLEALGVGQHSMMVVDLSIQL